MRGTLRRAATVSRRMPDRVVILGGGFAGIGAARKLRKADAEVVLVDQHDYHTFQPLLYQVATDLLETTCGRPPAARPVPRPAQRDRPRGDGRRDRPRDARQVRFAEMAPLDYDHLVLALGASVNFFGVEGAGEHAFPLYTLADAVRLKEHILERWEAADRDPELVDDGALNVVVVGGGADRHRERRRGRPSSTAASSPRTTRTCRRTRSASSWSRPARTLFTMFKPDIRKYTRETLAKRGVEVMLGETVAAVTPDAGAPEVGHGDRRAHLVWGAGLQANPSRRRSASSSTAAAGSRWSRT